MLITDDVVREAAEHLSQNDPALAPVIARVGLCSMRPHTNYYQELVESILGQQLSIKAAAAIEARFVAMFEGSFPTPEQILTKDVEELRAIGFSYAKGRYVQDLAQHVIDDRLSFDNIEAMSNEDIIKMLTAVKGVGEWTAHMFLMFGVGRTDILPVGDLGIRNGVRALYGFEDVPTPDQIREISVKYSWHPYESIASWYVWQSLDNAPAL